MNKRVVAIVATGVAAVFISVGAYVGFDAGIKRERERGALVASQANETDRKIMAFVLKRNPDATIRDFSDFPEVVQEEAKRVGIDYRLVMAQIDKESEFNPRAIGKAGEIGLLQVKPGTAAIVVKNLGDSLGIKYVAPQGKELGSLAIPRQNLRIGLAHLRSVLDEFGGNQVVALRAYNRGSGQAKEYRPGDTYAEDIAKKFMGIAQIIDGTMSMPKAEAAKPSMRGQARAESDVLAHTLTQGERESGHRYSVLFEKHARRAHQPERWEIITR